MPPRSAPGRSSRARARGWPRACRPRPPRPGALQPARSHRPVTWNARPSPRSNPVSAYPTTARACFVALGATRIPAERRALRAEPHVMLEVDVDPAHVVLAGAGVDLRVGLELLADGVRGDALHVEVRRGAAQVGGVPGAADLLVVRGRAKPAVDVDRLTEVVTDLLERRGLLLDVGQDFVHRGVRDVARLGVAAPRGEVQRLVPGQRRAGDRGVEVLAD